SNDLPLNNPVKVKGAGKPLRWRGWGGMVRLLLSVLIIISINVIASYVFFRLDLTGEKRYTISSTTVDQLKKIKDGVYIKVYLDGDLPPGFKRLKNSIKELLDEFRVYAKDNIEYEFIDPSANPDKKARN